MPDGIPIQSDKSGYRLWVPWGLVCWRGIVAPPALVLSLMYGLPTVASVIVLVTFFSDWMDGVLARRWSTATEKLRRADSRADVAFYFVVAVSLLIWRAELLQPYHILIAGLIACEVLCQVLNYSRFGCGTATHAWLCKAWAVMLCPTTILVLSADNFPGLASTALCLSLLWGFLAYLDVLLIIALLPYPAVDVPTAWHAWKQRQLLLVATNTITPEVKGLS